MERTKKVNVFEDSFGKIVIKNMKAKIDGDNSAILSVKLKDSENTIELELLT